jgi:diaminopimelate decarboxylase
VDGCDVVELATEFGTPFWVLSESRVRENHRCLRDAFRRVYPQTRIAYAAKANPEPAVIRILLSEGALVDAVSVGHMALAFKAGAAPGDLILNGNSKTEDELRLALTRGVGTINVDSLEEMELVAELQPRDATPVAVCLRLAADNQRYLEGDPEMRNSEWLGKFGMDTGDALSAAVLARRHPALDLAGVHHHLGFTAYGLPYDRDRALVRHRRQVEELVAFAQLLAEEGTVPRVFNLGGGYRRPIPGGWGPGRLQSFPTADEYAEAIGGTLAAMCAAHGLGTPTLVLEAGAYHVADAGVLVGRVGLQKTRRTAGETRQWVFLEGTGAYHLVRRLMFGFYHEVVLANRMDEPPDGAVSIAGPACAADDVAVDAPLPRPRRGDLVAVLDAGSYGEAVASDYCVVPMPQTLLARNGRAEVVRRAQTIDEVAASYSLPSWLNSDPAGPEQNHRKETT